MAMLVIVAKHAAAAPSASVEPPANVTSTALCSIGSSYLLVRKSSRIFTFTGEGGVHEKSFIFVNVSLDSFFLSEFL